MEIKGHTAQERAFLAQIKAANERAEEYRAQWNATAEYLNALLAQLAVAREGLEHIASGDWQAEGGPLTYARDTLRRIDEANAASGAKPSPGTSPASGNT